jgi:Spx/MgsR family transcriptional regulator
MPGGTRTIQVFGTKNCADTRKAQRFFSERRIAVHFVDLKERPASPGELRRFVQKFGIDAILNRDAPRYRELGLHVALLSPARWIETLAAEPALLRTPLVRCGNELTVGPAEELWRTWA